MLKVFCDCCGQEPKGDDFVFEATLIEVKTGYDLTSQNLNAQKQRHQQLIQICKECYQKHIAKFITYGKEKSVKK